MKCYNVLWIDDEPKKQKGFSMEAEQNGIMLSNYQTSKDGMEELSKNLNSYDAVILDAQVYNESTDEKAGLKGLTNSKSKIKELSSKRVIPYFIFTGQKYLTSEDWFDDMLGSDRYYEKVKDNKQLFKDIKSAADQQIETQIRHEHHSIFEIAKNYDKEVAKGLLERLVGIKQGAAQFDDENYFTKTRIILEHAFRRANQFGLLHDTCVAKGGSQVNLIESSKFLSGLDADICKVRCSKTHFSKIISENVRNLLFVTGAASHTVIADVTKNMDVQNYRSVVKTPYLLYSLTYQLMDVLIWLEEYLKVNPDVEKNRSLWENIEYKQNNQRLEKWELGEITRVAPNGWGTATLNGLGKSVSIRNITIQQKSLSKGDRVKVVTKESCIATDVERL